ncbi:solute carrier family 23 protein [Streptomyces sp. NPDC056013]|uniref:nucleobase:cation symporter-2 family protein n=1 Tax=Streptomyces sp. NPDC056013 TaxID=3345680 RepID=UPI0035E2E221
MLPRATDHTPPTPPHPVDEILPARRMLPAALQHVASMYAGLTAPPLIIGSALGLTPAQLSALLAAALLIAGLGTIAQTLGAYGVGARLPLVNGVSFAVVSPALATAATQGSDSALPTIFGATLVAGVLCLLFAPVFCRLVRFFPPVVSGCVITLVGVSLLPVAGTWARGGDAEAADFGSSANLALAVATLVITLTVHRMLSGRFLGRVAILIGMLAGTLIAVPLGKVDLEPLAQAPLFALPTPFGFGAPQFVPTVIATAVVVMIVSMMESTAALLALGAVAERPVQDRTIAGSLRALGLATVLGGVLGSFTSTSYAQNVGLVSLSRIRSRHVVTLCGAILVLMGFVPVLGSLVALVPLPVLGGAGVVFFGSVAVTGIRTLTKAALGTGHNALIVSVTLAFGLFPVLDPDFYARLPAPVATVLGSGITAGCLVAVLLNYLLNHLGRGTEADPDGISAEQVTALDTADTVLGARPSAGWTPFQPSARPSGTPRHGRNTSGTAQPAPAWPYMTGSADPSGTGRPHQPHEVPAPPQRPHEVPAPPHRPHEAPPPLHPSAAHEGAPRPAVTENAVFPGPFHPLHPRHTGPDHPRERLRAEAGPWQHPQTPSAPGDSR